MKKTDRELALLALGAALLIPVLTYFFWRSDCRERGFDTVVLREYRPQCVAKRGAHTIMAPHSDERALSEHMRIHGSPRR